MTNTDSLASLGSVITDSVDDWSYTAGLYVLSAWRQGQAKFDKVVHNSSKNRRLKL
jgi:hypothetical protein